MEQIGQIAPQNFFLWRGEAEGIVTALLNLPGTVALAQALTGQFVPKPVKPFQRQVVAQELHGVGVRQIQLGIVIQPRNPWVPVLLLEHAEQLRQVGYVNVGTIFYRLPEVLGRIVSGSVESNAFLNWVPIREHTPRNGWRSTPAVQ